MTTASERVMNTVLIRLIHHCLDPESTVAQLSNIKTNVFLKILAPPPDPTSKIAKRRFLDPSAGPRAKIKIYTTT